MEPTKKTSLEKKIAMLEDLTMAELKKRHDMLREEAQETFVNKLKCQQALKDLDKKNLSVEEMKKLKENNLYSKERHNTQMNIQVKIRTTKEEIAYLYNKENEHDKILEAILELVKKKLGANLNAGKILKDEKEENLNAGKILKDEKKEELEENLNAGKILKDEKKEELEEFEFEEFKQSELDEAQAWAEYMKAQKRRMEKPYLGQEYLQHKKDMQDRTKEYEGIELKDIIVAKRSDEEYELDNKIREERRALLAAQLEEAFKKLDLDGENHDTVILDEDEVRKGAEKALWADGHKGSSMTGKVQITDHYIPLKKKTQSKIKQGPSR